MNHRKLFYRLLIALLLSTSARMMAEQPAETLKIYLPREITVDDSRPTLGQVAILRGSQTLIARADVIGLGYLSTPDQSVVIDRHTLLSRLACSGIPASKVSLSGAEETQIRRHHQVITSDRLCAEALAFLKKNLPDPSICEINILRAPQEMILPAISEDIQFICKPADNGMRNQCKVTVTVFQQNRQIGRDDIVFQFRFTCRQAVTTAPIAKGDMISTENVKIENRTSNYPQPPEWTAPYGLIAIRSIPAHTIMTANMISPPMPAVLLKRNQSVAIKIENAGLIATATGKALQDGAAGETIKVQNVDSKIIIVAKVNDDGTVEPVF